MVGQVLARLGDLRLRQGRHDEAETLFERASGQTLARLGQAALALERGEPREAAADLDRFVAQLGAAEATTRAAALELAVRAHATAGDVAAAGRALQGLQAIARTLGTDPLAAAAQAAEGALRRAKADPPGAIACFERAAGLYQTSGAPYETARAQVEGAELLAAAGQPQAAARLARQAVAAFKKLGATYDEARARRRLQPAGPRAGSPAITGRQLEILRLVAKGMSNAEIAARLRLSDHTVKRHVANVLGKLGVSSRAAAVAQAATQGLLS
jgi:ATP/maltotriose-dependent transcriptional regulator MalT